MFAIDSYLELLGPITKTLPSQLGLHPKGLAGASGRVSRGPSLGDSTSAGAENSRATLHADRATDGDGILSSRSTEKRLFYPAFSLASLWLWHASTKSRALKAFKDPTAIQWNMTYSEYQYQLPEMWFTGEQWTDGTAALVYRKLYRDREQKLRDKEES